MNDALGVRGLERATNLHGVAQCLIERERTVERGAFDKLHDQVSRPDIVDLADVRMIQRGDGFGFALKALRELCGGDFNGYVAIQSRIVRAIHLAHPARAERRDDFVWPEFRTGCERHARLRV